MSRAGVCLQCFYAPAHCCSICLQLPCSLALRLQTCQSGQLYSTFQTCTLYMHQAPTGPQLRSSCMPAGGAALSPRMSSLEAGSSLKVQHWRFCQACCLPRYKITSLWRMTLCCGQLCQVLSLAAFRAAIASEDRGLCAVTAGPIVCSAGLQPLICHNSRVVSAYSSCMALLPRAWGSMIIFECTST